jgi:hypothetical protein
VQPCGALDEGAGQGSRLGRSPFDRRGRPSRNAREGAGIGVPVWQRRGVTLIYSGLARRVCSAGGVLVVQLLMNGNMESGAWRPQRVPFAGSLHGSAPHSCRKSGRNPVRAGGCPLHRFGWAAPLSRFRLILRARTSVPQIGDRPTTPCTPAVSTASWRPGPARPQPGITRGMCAGRRAALPSVLHAAGDGRASDG